MGEKVRGGASPVPAGRGLEMLMKKQAFPCSCCSLSELGFRVELVSIVVGEPLGQVRELGLFSLGGLSGEPLEPVPVLKRGLYERERVTFYTGT